MGFPNAPLVLALAIRSTESIQMIFRRLLPLSPLLAPFALLALASPALAEGNCPPGYFPTGGGNAGWVGCAPMDGGVGSYDDGYDDGGYDDGGYYEDDYYDMPPPVTYSAQDWADFAAATAIAEAEAEAERMTDPIYRQLKEGSWNFDSSPARSKAGVCMASYLSLGGGVLMADWAGEDQGTYLGFFGPGIPSVSRIKKAKVTLIQSGESQTVQAFLAPFPWTEGLGMILFAVPSTNALVTSIEDRQDYTVTYKGKTVIQGEWHSGSKARNWLKNCTSGR